MKKTAERKPQGDAALPFSLVLGKGRGLTGSIEMTRDEMGAENIMHEEVQERQHTQTRGMGL